MTLSFEKKLILLFSIITIGFIAGGIAVYLNKQTMLDTDKRMQHVREVLYEAEQVLSLAQDIVLSSRGYVITGDSDFQLPFIKASKIIHEHFNKLEELIKDNPIQQLRTDSLKKLIDERIKLSIQIIQLRKEKGFVAAQQLVASRKGKLYMDEIRNLIGEVQKEENQLMKSRQEANLKGIASFNRSFYILFGLILLLFHVGFFVIRHNLLARKKAVEQLKEYLHFFNNNNDLCGIANTVGYFETINTTFSNVLGYSEKEFCAMPFIDLIHPDDVAATLLEYQKLLAGAVTINFINRYRKKDGTYIYLDWNAAPNTLTGKLYCVARDITEWKKTEQTLRESLKETTDYKYALDESSIIAITDQKGIIKEVNDNFCKISKYSREELIGQDHRIINSGYHPKEFIRELWVTIANGKIWKGELKNKAKDGTVYWVDTTIVPFLNEEGKPYQYLAIRADITDRKKAEEQLLAVNKELEAFSYSVSHDLRAPLRGVNGFAKILKEDYGAKLDEEANRVLNNIMSSAKKMGQLIDDLLAFSRLGRKELVKNNIRMRDMVTEICEELKNTCQPNIEFDIKQLLPAQADNVAIKQVWVNLISNAIKYSEKKDKAIIEIGYDENGNEIIYYIKDNGAGFDMRYADKLFGVFQRLHSDKEFEGTGVGLAIVQRIIAKHGGRVWAVGVVNEGATFYFSLMKN